MKGNGARHRFGWVMDVRIGPTSRHECSVAHVVAIGERFARGAQSGRFSFADQVAAGQPK
jgi:hypothetical protein